MSTKPAGKVVQRRRAVAARQATGFEIHCGDALTILQELPDEHFALVVTSPPYWGLRSYGHKNEIGAEATVDEYLARLVRIFGQVRRTLRQDGVVWLVIGDTYTSGNRTYRAADQKSAARAMSSRPATPIGLKEKDLVGLPWRLAFALQADGWYLRGDVIWAKPNPMPESVQDRPHRSHEYVFMLTKSPNYFFDREAFSHPNFGEARFGRSVWTVPVGSRRAGHPAAFPIELVMPCVLSSSRPNDHVLDPFSGSGSVGLSCLRTSRQFTGIEIIPEFAECSRHILDDLAAQNRLRVVRKGKK